MIMDKFQKGPDYFATLTDRQIREVCFHKRDKDGVIVLPFDEEIEEEESVEDQTPEIIARKQMEALDKIAMVLGGNVKGMEESKAKIKKKLEEAKESKKE